MSKNVFVEIELNLEYVIFEFYSIMLLIIFFMVKMCYHKKLSILRV